MQKLLQHKLVEGGAARLVRADEDEGKRTDYRKVKLEILDEKLADQITERVVNSVEYGILVQHKSRLARQELELLKSAEDLFSDSTLWEFCENVRGLGAVAAMTFFTVIDTSKIVDKEKNQMVTAGKVFKYLGLVPGQRLKSGEKLGYNTQMKGRAWMISRNVIMASDPYYSGIYRLQKDFYLNRPDLVAKNGYVVRDAKGHYIATPAHYKETEDPETGKKKKEEIPIETVALHCTVCNEEVHAVSVEDRKKKPGWRAMIDAMASRWVRKLVFSHATEIIAIAEGLNFSHHRNYLPPKSSDDPAKIDDILERFRQEKIAQLRRYRVDFANTGSTEIISDNLVSYWKRYRGDE